MSDELCKFNDYNKIKEFEDFPIKCNILKGIFEMNWELPTPIQQSTIPLALSGKNILACAEPGSGKTGAFVIPLLELIDTQSNAIQALILVPSRELAMQTLKTINDLSKYLDIKVMMATGGTLLKDDVKQLDEKVHLIVATPGRILDLLKKKVAVTSKLKAVVMDEADKLLMQDFKAPLNEIICFLPKNVQKFVFSASLPFCIRTFIAKHMSDPCHIKLTENLTLKGVTQYYTLIAESQKLECLQALFLKLEINQSIVFCNTVKNVELLKQTLTENSYSCNCVHSKMAQDQRHSILNEFRQGLCRTLICTDIFTRGIDMRSVNVVINYDFPANTETYLHRIGRSGCFGYLGIAVNFITETDRNNLNKIEEDLATTVNPTSDFINPLLY